MWKFLIDEDIAGSATIVLPQARGAVEEAQAVRLCGRVDAGLVGRVGVLPQRGQRGPAQRRIPFADNSILLPEKTSS